MDREKSFVDLAKDLIKIVAKHYDQLEELKKKVEELERDIICLGKGQ